MSVGHNQIDQTMALRFFKEATRVYEELDEQKMAHMSRCKDIRARLPEIYERADSAGIPKKALKARLKVWIEDQRIAACEARKEAAVPEDDEDAEVYDQLCSALGDFIDTPLGQAAVGAADDPIQQNVVRIRNGISGMPGADATEA